MKKNLHSTVHFYHRHLVTVICKLIDRSLYLYTERLLTSINGSAFLGWGGGGGYGSCLYLEFSCITDNQPFLVLVSMELNCKIGSQLLPLFENIGVRSLQYFIILSRFMSIFLRNNFIVIFTYRTV